MAPSPWLDRFSLPVRRKGLIYVQPKTPLPPGEQEYYVMQSKFYTKGPYGEAGLQPFNTENALSRTPDYVVFNGSVGANAGG